MAVQESRVLPPKFIEDLAKDYGTQLTALTGQAIDTSKFAPTVAAQDPLQQQAATLAASGIGSFQPFVTAAQTQAADAATQLGTAATGIAGAESLLGTGAGTGAGSVSSYMSPYQTQVIDATLAEFDRNRAIQEQAIRDQQAQLGALGAGRAGVQLAEFGTGQARERALLQAGLLQQGFGQAQAAAQQNFANQMGLAGALPGLQRADVSTLGQLGAVDRSLTQAGLDAQREATRQATFLPQEQLDRFAGQVTGIMGGYPAQFQTTNVPNPTPLQNALAIGSTAAGIFGALNPAQTNIYTGKRPA